MSNNQALAAPDKEKSVHERKNLALQLNSGSKSSQNASEVNLAAPQPQENVRASANGNFLEQAPESERSDAFSMPVSDADCSSARQGFNQLQNLKSAGQNLEDLDVALDGVVGQPGMPIEQQDSADLRMSAIQPDNASSGKKGDGEDEIAEMEKLLKSGGAFGGKDLSNTFKKIRNQIDQDDSKHDLPSSGKKKSGKFGKSAEGLSDPALVMDSPSQNSFLQNQLADEGSQQYEADDAAGQSDSAIDLNQLTESQLLALQEQAAQ